MADIFKHEIAENSAFFQGHIDQFFTSEDYSFKVISNKADDSKTQELAVKRFKARFAKEMNRYISQRNIEGANIPHVDPDTLRVEAIKLIDKKERDDEDEVSCGEYQIFPDSAICTQNNCNEYFTILDGKTCHHDKSKNWRQITFLSFCIECGWLMPLHYNTNIMKDCPRCKERKGLSKLNWTKRDDLQTYTVSCKQCGLRKKLLFFNCNHEHGTRSSLPDKRFSGITARSSAIIHPKVVSFTDITRGAEAGVSRITYQQGRAASEAFVDFFPELPEELLYLSAFRDEIVQDENFWNSSTVLDHCNDLGISASKKDIWPRSDLINLVHTLLESAAMFISRGAAPEATKDRYKINHIEAALNKVKRIDFDEKDLQGCYLLVLNEQDKSTSIPESQPSNYASWLDHFGLREIKRIPNIRMIQALLGIIEGSTRREPSILFRPITNRKNNEPTVYVRDFFTEGILFQLNYRRLVKWIYDNASYIDDELIITGDEASEALYHHLLAQSEFCKKAVETLLHTYSHILIQQSTIDTGLEERSLAEAIYPQTGSVFIYSTSSINTGGLEYTFNYHLEDWFQRIKELASDCPQDPACMKDEGGSCNACCYLPEFVCERFNLDLDRSALVGGGNFSIGYFI